MWCVAIFQMSHQETDVAGNLIKFGAKQDRQRQAAHNYLLSEDRATTTLLSTLGLARNSNLPIASFIQVQV